MFCLLNWYVRFLIVFSYVLEAIAFVSIFSICGELMRIVRSSGCVLSIVVCMANGTGMKVGNCAGSRAG